MSKEGKLSSAVVGILVLTVLYFCLDYYFRMSPGLVVIRLVAQYHTNAVGIGAFVSAFYLGYLLMQLPSGYLLDRYPVRLVLAVSITICSCAFMGFMNLHIYWLGLFLRFITGLTSAFSFVSVLYIARVYLPLHYFSFISGVTIALGALTGSLAQVGAAALMRYIHWHFVFILFSSFGLLIAAVLLLPALSLPTVKSKIQKPFEVSSLLSQTKILFRHPGFVLNGMIGGLFYLPTSILAAAWGVTLLRFNYHVTHTQASSGVMLLFLGWALGSPAMSMLSEHFNKPGLLVCISALFAAATSILLIYFPAWVGGHVYGFMLLLGLLSSVQVVVWKLFSWLCPPELSGVGVGLTNMLIMFVGVVVHLVAGWSIHVGDLSVGLWIIPVAFSLASILVWLVPQNASMQRL